MVEGKKMRALVLFLAVIPCVASLSDTAIAQSAGTGGTRDFVTSPQMVFPIRPRNEPGVSTPVPTIPPYYPYSYNPYNSYNSYPYPYSPVVRLRRAYPVFIRR
jgi:hypothetical protein